MTKKKTKAPDLTTILMGGPQGRGRPISPEALGIMDAKGFPLDPNDGRNMTWHEPARERQRMEEFWGPILQEVGRQAFAPDPHPEPEGMLGSILQPLLAEYINQQIDGLQQKAAAVPSVTEPLTKFETTPAGKALAFLQGLMEASPAEAERRKAWTP